MDSKEWYECRAFGEVECEECSVWKRTSWQIKCCRMILCHDCLDDWRTKAEKEQICKYCKKNRVSVP